VFCAALTDKCLWATRARTGRKMYCQPDFLDTDAFLVPLLRQRAARLVDVQQMRKERTLRLTLAPGLRLLPKQLLPGRIAFARTRLASGLCVFGRQRGRSFAFCAAITDKCLWATKARIGGSKNVLPGRIACISLPRSANQDHSTFCKLDKLLTARDTPYLAKVPSFLQLRIGYMLHGHNTTLKASSPPNLPRLPILPTTT
jgi:hypothetical protein